MTGRKVTHVVTTTHEPFHFRGHPEAIGAVTPPIQGTDADRVARDQGTAGDTIPEREGKNATEAHQKLFRTSQTVQCGDDLAIGVAAICVRSCDPTPQFLV